MKRRDRRAPEAGAVPAGPSQRQLRVGEELRHAIAHALERGHFRDPALAGASITVTEVRVSPDLKSATAYVTPLGGANVEEVVRALQRASAYFRGEVARAVTLRYAPTITFAADTSFDYASRIHGILHRPEVARDLDAPEDDEGGEPPAR